MDTNIFRTKAGHRLASFGGIGHGLRLERTVGTIGTMLEGKAPWKAMVFPRSYHSIWDLPSILGSVEFSFASSNIEPFWNSGGSSTSPKQIMIMVDGLFPSRSVRCLFGNNTWGGRTIQSHPNTPTSGFPKWIVQMLNGVAFDADQRPKMNHSISPKWKRWLVNLRSPKGAGVWLKKTIWICFKV